MTNRFLGRKLLLLALAAAVLLLSACAFAAEAPTQKIVRAATVDELLAAIAPDTLIELTARSYNLTEAANYGGSGGEHYFWRETYDGYELVIGDVSNLTICAERDGTELLTAPRYSCVLKFENCRGIVIEDLTVGHSMGPGFCTGAVLHFDDCSDVTIESCDLYGCGTYGVEAEHCQGITTRNSIIRDCSYGAADASGSRDMVFDNCKFYGIEGYGGIFNFSSCQDCALLNSLVRNCSSTTFLELRSVRGFYLGGCEIVNNDVEGLLYCTSYPVTVEGCSFRNNGGRWYYEDWGASMRAVNPAGDAYSERELASMELMADAVWTPPAVHEPDAEAPEVSEDGMIHVRTVDELLASIRPGASIWLEPGVYDLSESAGYGTYSGEYYYWMSCYDGPGLVINGCDGLRIAAAGPHMARIVAEPRYCEVLSFEGCSDLTLEGFTAGHTQIVDVSCAGGVLSFMGCGKLRVADCSLYGCGIMGITAFQCSGMDIERTEIHDCSDGAIYFYDCRDASLRACNIHDIHNFTYQLYSCENITADGEVLPSGASF